MENASTADVLCFGASRRGLGWGLERGAATGVDSRKEEMNEFSK